MKLHLFFLLMDVILVLVYPFLFVAHRLRRLFGLKR